MGEGLGPGLHPPVACVDAINDAFDFLLPAYEECGRTVARSGRGADTGEDKLPHCFAVALVVLRSGTRRAKEAQAGGPG